MNEEKKQVPIIIGGTIIAATIAVGGLIFITENSNNQNSPQLIPENFSGYRDGRFYNEASYYVEPTDTNETIEVVIELEDGIISNIEAVSIENGEIIPNDYLEEFENEISNLIIGKPLNEVSEVQVSGSSLTTEAFIEAVEKIKQDASV